MSEEELTRIIAERLARSGWKILSMDFPHSGTGMRFPVSVDNNNRQLYVIPDIVAVAGSQFLVLENKCFFDSYDLLKVRNMKVSSLFLSKIKRLNESAENGRFLFGIGLPLEVITSEVKRQAEVTEIDLLIGVGEIALTSWQAQKFHIFGG